MKNKEVDVEFTRSVAEEPPQSKDRDPLDRDRIFGGAPELDQPAEVDEERETEKWEKRYGTEASRDKLGFDGGD